MALAMTLGAADARADAAPAAHGVSKVSWSSPPSTADLQYIAAHDSMLITDGYPVADSEVATLHAMNPALTVLPYINALETTGADHVYPGWCSVPMTDYVCPAGDTIVAQHPDWELRDAAGDVVYDRACGTSCVVMDPANPGYIAYREQEMQWYVDTYGYDGVFLDQIFPSPSTSTYDATPIDPRTGGPYTATAWAQDVTTFLSGMKQALGSRLLIINSLGSGAEYAANSAAEDGFLSVADGAAEEGFIQWSTDTAPRSVAAWLQDVQSIAAVSSMGKLAIGWTDATASQASAGAADQAARYSLASYLLGAGPAALRYFNFQDYVPDGGDPCADGAGQPADPDWTIELGDPAGPFYQVGSLYERDFTAGKVIVNPTDSAAGAALGGAYTTANGASVTSVDLEPQSAEILLARGSGGSGAGGSAAGASGTARGAAGTGPADHRSDGTDRARLRVTIRFPAAGRPARLRTIRMPGICRPGRRRCTETLSVRILRAGRHRSVGGHAVQTRREHLSRGVNTVRIVLRRDLLRAIRGSRRAILRISQSCRTRRGRRLRASRLMHVRLSGS